MPTGSGYTSKGFVVGGVNSAFDSGMCTMQVINASITTSLLVKIRYNFEYEPTPSGTRLAGPLSNLRMTVEESKKVTEELHLNLGNVIERFNGK
jgi:hypothetical protein